jgi:hypothetical protein
LPLLNIILVKYAPEFQGILLHVESLEVWNLGLLLESWCLEECEKKKYRANLLNTIVNTKTHTCTGSQLSFKSAIF